MNENEEVYCRCGRKIKPSLECVVDNGVYSLVKPLSDFFHSIHLTPNHITTLSLIFGLLSVFFLYKSLHDDNYKVSLSLFAVFYLFSYVLDCVDGYYARKYDMVTQFGDYYDHFKDNVILLLVIAIIYTKVGLSPLSVFIIIVSLLVALLHIGCQECHYDKDNEKSGKSLSFLKMLCPTCDEPESSMKYSRYLGVGSFNVILVVCICVAVINKHSPK